MSGVNTTGSIGGYSQIKKEWKRDVERGKKKAEFASDNNIHEAVFSCRRKFGNFSMILGNGSDEGVAK